MISTCFLSGALHVDHTGSAYDYVKALAKLSTAHCDIWTTYYPQKAKKTASRRLCQFLNKGSQGGPADFWNQVAIILHHVPDIVLEDSRDQSRVGDDVQNSLPLLESLHHGITNKEEPRSNQRLGWQTYIAVTEQIITNKSQILENSLAPLIIQYIRPTPELSRWTLPSSHQQAICVQAISLIVSNSAEVFDGIWKRLSQAFIGDLQTSLPEQSKDYIKSQESLIAQAKRWYALRFAVFRSKESEQVNSLFMQTANAELKASIDMLKARNGKPYSAAATVNFALELGSDFILHDIGTKDLIDHFAQDDISDLLLTPSSSYLISVLYILDNVEERRDVYQSCIRRLVDAPASEAKYKALQTLISSPFLHRVDESTDLYSIIKHSLEQALDGDEDCWRLIDATLGNKIAPVALTNQILATTTKSLTVADRITPSLRGLELAVNRNTAAVKAFSTSPDGSLLLSNLLYLTESPDEDLSSRSRNLNNTIDMILSIDQGSNEALRPMIDIIQKGFEAAESTSLSYVILPIRRSIRPHADDLSTTVSSR